MKDRGQKKATSDGRIFCLGRLFLMRTVLHIKTELEERFRLAAA